MNNAPNALHRINVSSGGRFRAGVAALFLTIAPAGFYEAMAETSKLDLSGKIAATNGAKAGMDSAKAGMDSARFQEASARKNLDITAAAAISRLEKWYADQYRKQGASDVVIAANRDQIYQLAVAEYNKQLRGAGIDNYAAK